MACKLRRWSTSPTLLKPSVAYWDAWLEEAPDDAAGIARALGDIGRANEREAERLRIRSSLMIASRKLIESRGLTQADAAKLFGVPQPRISDLVRGKIDLFSIDTLIDMLARGGPGDSDLGLDRRDRSLGSRDPGPGD